MAQQSPHGVEALTEVCLCEFSESKLWDLYREFPNLGYDITWLCAHEELIVDENLVSVGRRTARERIAMLLIHLYKRAESVGAVDPDGVRFPVKQQHIADALGLSLVHTNKTLRRIQRDGLCRIENGYLILGNMDAIRRLADYYGLPMREWPLI